MSLAVEDGETDLEEEQFFDALEAPLLQGNADGTMLDTSENK